MTEADAIHYLAAPTGAPWSWDREGGAIVWWNGETVALREEVLVLLETQSLRGWPPFEAFVLLLAACRGRSCQEVELARGSRESPAGALVALFSVGTTNAFARGCAALGRIAALPAPLRQGVGAKRVLGGLLCEHCPSATPQTREEQREVSRVLQNWGSAVLTLRTGVYDPLPALAAIAEAFGNVTDDELIRRLQTGLDAPVPPASIPVRPAAQVRELIRQMAAQPETAGLARAVRDVLAALRLPRRVERSEELSSSGAADIANQGPLDRLLLSELAQDNDILAARVALREALYLRRDPPATPPAGSFSLLLDAGVRSWGLPRVFSTAVALAIAALDERRATFHAWRALDPPQGGLVPLHLTSAVGVQTELSALACGAHPGDSLSAFFARPEFESRPGEAQAEAVIILTPEAAADPDFQRLLAEAPRRPPTLYFATVTRTGAFALTLHPIEGRAPACAAQIDLSAIVDAPEALRDERAAIDLPAFFQVEPAPLLLPVPSAVRLAIKLRDGRMCAVTEKRELYTWLPGLAHGAQRHAHGLPGNRVLFLREETDERILYISSARDDGTVPLVFYSLQGGASERIGVKLRSAPIAVTASNREEILFFHFPTRLDAVDARTGEVRESRNLKEPGRIIAQFGVDFLGGTTPTFPPDVVPGAVLERCGPRYFRSSELVAAGWNGVRLRWPLIRDPHGCIAVFERPNHGLTGITEDGRMGSLALGEFEPIAHWTGGSGLRFVELSADGRLLWLRRPFGAGTDVLINVETRSQIPLVPRTSNNRPMGFDGDAATVPTRSMRRRFRAIGLSAKFELVLEAKKGGFLVLEPWSDARIAFTPRPEVKLIRGGEWREFHPLPLPKGFPDPLQVAEFPDGSKAFLDPRGLLHLRSRNPDLPEMTLTLGEGACAIWTSQGARHGPAFYLGEQRSSARNDRLIELERFVSCIIQ